MMQKQSKKTGNGSTQRTYKKDRTENSKIKLKCWTCGGPHLRRDCSQKKKDENSQDKQKENTHGLAMKTQSSDITDITK